mgnify:CR=1 FL=1
MGLTDWINVLNAVRKLLKEFPLIEIQGMIFVKSSMSVKSFAVSGLKIKVSP